MNTSFWPWVQKSKWLKCVFSFQRDTESWCFSATAIKIQGSLNHSVVFRILQDCHLIYKVKVPIKKLVNIKEKIILLWSSGMRLVKFHLFKLRDTSYFWLQCTQISSVTSLVLAEDSTDEFPKHQCWFIWLIFQVKHSI